MNKEIKPKETKLKYSSVVEINTDHAGKYIQQLCKHFAHKVDVKYDDQKGHVDFPMGVSNMTASPNTLQITSETDESEDARRTIEVIIEKHLVKFAWREEISFDWNIK